MPSRSLLVPAFAATLLLAACSSGADGGDSASSSSAAMWSATAPTTKPMSATDVAAMDAAAATGMASAAGQQGAPGMWIGVWDPARGWHIGAYGSAVEGGAPAVEGDHSRIGSLTKTFTATAVLQQVADGKMSLSDTIGDTLPDLAADFPAVADVTVEQLLGMTSGIPDYANTGLLMGRFVSEPEKVWSADEIIRTTLAAGVTPAGGTDASYSTTNYLILGEMLAKVTGQPSEQVITSVATEAGLDETALPAPGVNAMPAPASTGYLYAPGLASLEGTGVKDAATGPVVDGVTSWGAAGGGMYSTVADQGRWAGTGLGTATLPKALGEQRLSDVHTFGKEKYGLGIVDYGNGWIGHTGQTIGWEAVTLYNTQTGAVFVGMVNETGSMPQVGSVMAEFFPEIVGPVFL